MPEQFNFNNLKSVYLEALSSNDKTLIFESHVGYGMFLFMMFLSDEEDIKAKDMLFIYLRNTNCILPIKMYGNHKKGDFNVYINKQIKDKLIEELQLNHAGVNFDFIRFLNQLNDSIPTTMNTNDKINKLRQNLEIIRPLNIIDESLKTVLIGEKKLPEDQKPQDKTLRKLYMYTDSDPKDITLFIEILKKFNMTVVWTTEDQRRKATNIRTLIEKHTKNK